MFTDNDSFFVGCNYWASHAGVFMWREWRADIVERDFAKLSAGGIKVIRCFPLWPDFQPVEEHNGYGQEHVEFRYGEIVSEDEPETRACLSPVMVERFHQLCCLAEKYKLRLIVGLITGWMSGRAFVPHALERRNFFTDPIAVQYEIRLVQALVANLKNEPAIIAWDLGNECNCLGKYTIPELWLWSKAIADAIHLADSSRLVISGMHATNDEVIRTIGETTDILCTHPYPPFTSHCRTDFLDSFKSAFHAVAQTKYMEDIGGKPAFVEEIGSLGPTQTSDRVSALYLKGALWNCLAHTCRGILWWCSSDFSQLAITPYEWCGMERELGLFKTDGSSRETLNVLGEFGSFAAETHLPPHRTDAVCLLAQYIDKWGVAFGSFLLAKKAGFDISYQLVNQPLKEAGCYLLPSISGFNALPRRCSLALMAAVHKGATLYISSDDTGIQPWEPAGVEIESVAETNQECTLCGSGYCFKVRRSHEIRLGHVSGKVLAVDEKERPIFTEAEYGAGRILFLALPLERILVDEPRAFEAGAPDYAAIYRTLMKEAGIRRCATRNNPMLTLTEHQIDADNVLLCIVNQSTSAVNDTITFNDGWKVEGSNTLPVSISPKTGKIVKMHR